MSAETKYIIQPIMSRVTASKHLNDQILTGINKGYNEFKIIIQENSKTYPNICVPIAATIDYYKEMGMDFEIIHECVYRDYIKHTSFDHPCIVEENINCTDLLYPLDKVWCFSTSEGVNSLVTAYINAIRQSDSIESGVLASIEWCINEIMDNVLQHSEAPKGFIMTQLQHESKRFSVCIFDYGRGIYNSFKGSKYHPVSPIDAISLALSERVTRDEKIGQGNGMWGLSRIINENGGTIRISSCGAVYSCINGSLSTIDNGDFNFGKKVGTTRVDFQLDYSKSIDIVSALNGYKPIDLWLENLENDAGDYAITVLNESSGTGTRKSALKFRNMVLNIIRETHKKVILDFTGINLISSSFADELIGKMISEYGFMFFINTITITNISKINSFVINRSVEQRMAQTYYDHLIDEDTEE